MGALSVYRSTIQVMYNLCYYYLFIYGLPPFAESRINPAISSGCETSDAWLAFTEIVVAFICRAN